MQQEKEKRKWTVSPARAARYEAEREQIIRVAYRLMAAAAGRHIHPGHSGCHRARDTGVLPAFC